MSKVIWKIRLEETEIQSFHLPVGSALLSIQLYHGLPCILAMINEKEDEEELIMLRTYVENSPIEESIDETDLIGIYCDTASSFNRYVFRVFQSEDNYIYVNFEFLKEKPCYIATDTAIGLIGNNESIDTLRLINGILIKQEIHRERLLETIMLHRDTLQLSCDVCRSMGYGIMYKDGLYYNYIRTNKNKKCNMVATIDNTDKLLNYDCYKRTLCPALGYRRYCKMCSSCEYCPHYKTNDGGNCDGCGANFKYKNNKKAKFGALNL